MEDFTYRIVFSARRSLSITVSPADGVIVRAPMRMNPKRIEAFVAEKSDWIRKHLAGHADIVRLNGKKDYTDGDEFLYMGKKYRLVLSANRKQAVSLSGDFIVVQLKDTSDKRKVKTLIDNWYSRNAREILTGLTIQVTDQYRDYDFRPQKIVVRASKTRWGSCSSSGVISLSSELIKLDPKFYDYIILHELCHLSHHNHGAGFYKLLEKLKPDYREIRKELRKYVMK